MHVIYSSSYSLVYTLPYSVSQSTPQCPRGAKHLGAAQQANSQTEVTSAESDLFLSHSPPSLGPCYKPAAPSLDATITPSTCPSRHFLLLDSSLQPSTIIPSDSTPRIHFDKRAHAQSQPPTTVARACLTIQKSSTESARIKVSTLRVHCESKVRTPVT